MKRPNVLLCTRSGNLIELLKARKSGERTLSLVKFHNRKRLFLFLGDLPVLMALAPPQAAATNFSTTFVTNVATANTQLSASVAAPTSTSMTVSAATDSTASDGTGSPSVVDDSDLKYPIIGAVVAFLICLAVVFYCATKSPDKSKLAETKTAGQAV